MHRADAEGGRLHAAIFHVSGLHSLFKFAVAKTILVLSALHLPAAAHHCVLLLASIHVPASTFTVVDLTSFCCHTPHDEATLLAPCELHTSLLYFFMDLKCYVFQTLTFVFDLCSIWHPALKRGPIAIKKLTSFEKRFIIIISL